MPIGPRGEPLPYTDNGAGQAAGPPFDPRAMNPGVGTGPAMPPGQMPPIEAVVARIQELQAELQQLVALAEQMGGGPGGGVGGAGGTPIGGNTGPPGAMPGILA